MQGLGTKFTGWGKNGGGSGGGAGGGGMYNTSYGGGESDANEAGKEMKSGLNSKDFRNAQNKNGTSQTGGEFLKSRYQQGRKNFKSKTKFTGDDFSLTEQ